MASRRGRVAGSIAHELAGETLYCLAALFGSMGCYRGNQRYRTSTLGGKHQIGTVTPSPQPVPPIMAGSWNMLLNAWDMAPKLKRQIICPVSMPCTYGVPCSRRRAKQRKKGRTLILVHPKLYNVALERGLLNASPRGRRAARSSGSAREWTEKPEDIGPFASCAASKEFPSSRPPLHYRHFFEH